jgi:hypothetical protein
MAFNGLKLLQWLGMIMLVRSDLRELVVQALKSFGGAGTVPEVCKAIWDAHESDLRASGELFYTWQYDVRWAAMMLRKDGVLEPKPRGSREPWKLVS